LTSYQVGLAGIIAFLGAVLYVAWHLTVRTFTRGSIILSVVAVGLVLAVLGVWALEPSLSG
jgi:hypothetical protein